MSADHQTAAAKAAQPAQPSIDPLGVNGLVVGFGDSLTEPANRAALAFCTALDRAGLAGIAEAAPALTSVHIRLDPAFDGHDGLLASLRAMLGGQDWFAAPLPQDRRLWRVPACFGQGLAPQLEKAAALAGLSPDQAVAALCAEPLRVQTIGFAPGQPYLGQLPRAWDLPRQTGLTAQVPEGALAVAIRQMVLFSVPTPTGWRHVGQSALRLFRPESDRPFLLRPGDAVLFHPVDRAALERLKAHPDGGALAEPMSGGAA